MSNCFGSDATKGGIEFQFRTIKQDAKRQKACFHAGGDPKDLGIGSGSHNGRGYFCLLHLDHFVFSPTQYFSPSTRNHLLTCL
ncbi:hypothetical protein BGZ60DRAFT_386763 [Tricladium varicosporioides]|nr:hypothetical protein BGZ60DRAFT_386763 [Hymenoscyphus varicosporioides]